jgi:hypothetical protein
MPSVIVSWSGQCSELFVRENLCWKLEELAELSHSYFEVPPSIRRFDHVIKGNILLSGSLFSAPPSSSNLVRVYESLPQEVDPLGFELRVAGPLGQKLRKIHEDLFSLPQVDLYGIEFRLFDGRHLYEEDDRISFIFLRMEEYPELDGAIVYVEDRNQCQYYENEMIRQADWFLGQPHIHLRYYCESWMDMLLGWIKHFYIPNLNYWRYKELPGYEIFSNIDPYDSELRDEFFEVLKEGFHEEVRNWSGIAAETSEFWRRIRELQQQQEEET